MRTTRINFDIRIGKPREIKEIKTNSTIKNTIGKPRKYTRVFGQDTQ